MVDTIAKAGATIGTIQAVDYLPTGTHTFDIIKLLVQLAIGVFGYLTIKKKKNEVISNQNQQ